MKEIKIPELAESIMEGTIAEWLVEQGEKVEQGEPIIELETDKVNIEVQAEHTGVITEITKGEGEDVVVGEVVGKIDENADAASVEETEDAGESTEAEPKEAETTEEPADETTSTSESDPREVI